MYHFTALNFALFALFALFHRSIRMAPNQVSLLHVGLVRRRLQNHSQKMTKPKCNLGDYVHLSLMRRMFKKGYMSNFTEEVFCSQ